MTEEALIAELTAGYPISKTAALVLVEFKVKDDPVFAAPAGRSGGSGRRGSKIAKAWNYVTDEVYSLLCSDDPRYKDERTKLQVGGTVAVSMLGGLLATRFGLEAATASSLAALALYIPLRIGVQAWGRAHQAAKEDRELAKAEREKMAEAVDLDALARSQDKEDRLLAINYLKREKVDAKEALPVLIGLAADAEAEVRSGALRLLTSFGEEAKIGLPVIYQATRDGDYYAIVTALAYLREYESNDSLVDYLLVNVKDYGGDVQLWAIFTLGHLGARATRALPVLRRIKKIEVSQGRGPDNPDKSARKVYEAAEWVEGEIKAECKDLSSPRKPE